MCGGGGGGVGHGWRGGGCPMSSARFCRPVAGLCANRGPAVSQRCHCHREFPSDLLGASVCCIHTSALAYARE